MTYEIKKKYNDFIVIEIPNSNLKIDKEINKQIENKKINNCQNGLIALMIKKDIDFYSAKHHLEKYVNFTYNGIKDKTALTYQLIEINKIKKPLTEDDKIEIKQPNYTNNILEFIEKSQTNTNNHINLEDLYIPEKNITVIPLFFAKNKVFPGNLKKNYFIINLYTKTKLNIKNENFKFINYFDEQRFGRNNLKIAKKLIKKQFKDAIKLLEEQFNNIKTTGDLNKIRDILKIILNSYQSYIFNKSISKYINESNNQITINEEKYNISKQLDIKEFPLIGFDSRKEILNKKYEDIIYDLLEEDNINFRNFIIRELRNLSMDHSLRKSMIETNLKINKKEDLYTFQFFIEKGSYATMLLKQYYELNKR